MISKIIDYIAETISPAWGLSRRVDRENIRSMIDQINDFTGATGGVGYEAVMNNRLGKIGRGGEVTENTLPLNQFVNARWFAWQLYRNNPQARKIVSSLESKIVGRGNAPQSLATIDGKPNEDFRIRAEQLWKASINVLDVRGEPGQGGQSIGGLQRLALKNTIISGEVLARVVELTKEQQNDRNAAIPLQIQLIHAHRLADDLNDEGNFYRGIEFDQDGRRVAYHVHDVGQFETPSKIPANEVFHLYVPADVDNMRGVSWFAPILEKMRDVKDYEYHEMQAAKMAACIVLGYRKGAGTKKLGLNAPPSLGTNDSDDNDLEFIQPGMFINLGKDGALEGFNPGRPNEKAVDFLNHIIRSQAAGVPGVKASTITGDYRGASFTSERAADNETWPELRALQDWFNGSFNRPLYNAMVDAGIRSGWFNGVISPSQYSESRQELLAVRWSSPVQPAINPKDEVAAAAMRIALGVSTPQEEAAALGRNWEDILRDVKKFIERAEELGLPEDVIDSYLGKNINGNQGEKATEALAAQAKSTQAA